MVSSALICFVELAVWWNGRWNSDALRAEPSRLLNLSSVIPYVSAVFLVMTRKVRKIGLSMATGAGSVATVFSLCYSVYEGFFHQNSGDLPHMWLLTLITIVGVGLACLPHGFMAWCAVKAWRDLETKPRGLVEFFGLSCLGSLFTLACYWPMLWEFWPAWRVLW